MYDFQNTELNITNVVTKSKRLKESTWLSIFLPKFSEYLYVVKCLKSKIKAYSIKDSDTNDMQAIIQLEIAVMESVFGDFDVM